MSRIKRAMAFGIGFLIAWLVVRLIMQYLQTVRCEFDIESAAVPPQPQPEPPTPPMSGEKDHDAVNLNTADLATLIALPGVGPILAERIVAQRQQSAFSSVDELVRVAGIGAALLERLRPEVTV